MPYYIYDTGLKMPVTWAFDPKFPMSDFRPFLKGDPVSEQDIAKFPKKIIVTDVKVPKDLPEVISNGSVLGFVNVEVKDYLEQHDPGLHKFIPISIHLAGTDYVFEYFFLYTSNKISSICFEKSVFREGVGKEAAKKSHFRLKVDLDGNVDCFLYKRKVAGCNLWRNPDEEMQLVYFCSDEFYDFIKKHQIRGWGLHACKWEE